MKITVREPGILFDLLLDKLKPISKSRVRKLAQNGHIFLDGEPVARVDRVLQPGQTLEIRNPRKEKTSAPFPILFEDNWLIVVEKPAGVLSMNKEDDKTDTFLYAVNQALRQRPRNRKRAYLVHRLDRESSGVMLFAFSPEIKRALQENWDKTEKLYYALVEGRPPQKEGTIQSWLMEDRTLTMRSGPKSPKAKYAVTHYRVLKEHPAVSLLEVKLETGRKNQIRVHLSELGCPIAGDRKYGAKGNPIHRLALHAFSLSFDHPVTGKRIQIRLPLPKAFEISG